MSHLKMVFKLLILALLISGTAACSSKKGKSAGLRDRRGQMVDRNGNQIYVPGGPAANVNSQGCSNCGYIYGGSGDFQTTVASFLNLEDPSLLGTLSAGQGQATGIFFRGNVSGQSGSALRGEIEIIVWDHKAEVEGPYVVKLGLVNSSSDLRTGARLTFQDDTGSLTMNGQFTAQGTFTGTVNFRNNGQGEQTLGQFITGDCSFITAGCYQ
jgi:hypothetical protein